MGPRGNQLIPVVAGSGARFLGVRDARSRATKMEDGDRQVRNLAKEMSRVYGRYRVQGLAMHHPPRLAAVRERLQSRSPLETCDIEIPLDAKPVNEALVLESAADLRKDVR